VNIATLAAVIAVATAVSGGLSGLLGHWMTRRAASGRVATSEAAVLWQQAQDMRAMLLAEKEKAEEQRDRLIEAYTQQLFPLLSEVNATVSALAAAVAEDIRLSHEAVEELRGGNRALSPSQQGDANSQ
jgi:hypothetical protein